MVKFTAWRQFFNRTPLDQAHRPSHWLRMTRFLLLYICSRSRLPLLITSSFNFWPPLLGREWATDECLIHVSKSPWLAVICYVSHIWYKWIGIISVIFPRIHSDNLFRLPGVGEKVRSSWKKVHEVFYITQRLSLFGFLLNGILGIASTSRLTYASLCSFLAQYGGTLVFIFQWLWLVVWLSKVDGFCFGNREILLIKYSQLFDSVIISIKYAMNSLNWNFQRGRTSGWRKKHQLLFSAPRSAAK